MYILVQTDFISYADYIGEWCSVHTVYRATDCLTTVLLE